MKSSVFSLLFFFLIAIIHSCQMKGINNSESINYLFDSSNFNIKIENRGCFIFSESSYTCTKKSNGYFIECKETSKNKLISYAKMDSLRNFLIERNINKPQCKCTNLEYIKLSNNDYSIDYTNRCCSGKEATFINDFLDYYDLSSTN